MLCPLFVVKVSIWTVPRTLYFSVTYLAPDHRCLRVMVWSCGPRVVLANLMLFLGKRAEKQCAEPCCNEAGSRSKSNSAMRNLVTAVLVEGALANASADKAPFAVVSLCG